MLHSVYILSAIIILNYTLRVSEVTKGMPHTSGGNKYLDFHFSRSLISLWQKYEVRDGECDMRSGDRGHVTCSSPGHPDKISPRHWATAQSGQCHITEECSERRSDVQSGDKTLWRRVTLAYDIPHCNTTIIMIYHYAFPVNHTNNTAPMTAIGRQGYIYSKHLNFPHIVTFNLKFINT